MISFSLTNEAIGKCFFTWPGMTGIRIDVKECITVDVIPGMECVSVNDLALLEIHHS